MLERTIYIEVHDSIGDIVAKITAAQSDDLLLVVPRNAIMLQSLINFRLLKSQADNLGKTITLSTEGGLGENLAREASLEIIETLKPTTTQIMPDETVLADEMEPEAEVDDIEVSSDEPDESGEADAGAEEDEETAESSSGLSRWAEFRNKKFNVRLYDKAALDDEDDGEQDDEEEKEKKEKDDGNDMPKRSLSALRFKLPKFTSSKSFRLPKVQLPKIQLTRQHWLILGIVLAGIAVLVSVGCFVLPRAYAAIEVQSEAYKKQFGFVVADEDDLQAAGPNLVTGRYIEVVRENVVDFTASGEKNRGVSAAGKITIINTTGTIQGLLANTRFQAPNGLIFRSQSEMLVPPAAGRTAGRAVVDAVADEGGAKYNLPAGTRLSIPGLGSAGVDVVYGEITGAFAGGTDDIVKVVSEADVNKAKEEAAKNVFATAETELTDLLKRGEAIMPGFIQNDVIDALPSVSIGTEQQNFDVRVQSRSWVLAVKKGELEKALANAASFEVPEGKKVTERTLSAAKTEVVESNFLTHRINLVVTLDGRVGPHINTDEIVQAVANKPLAEAREYISSIPNIISGNIELWPSFISRVPLIHNNIRVKIIYIGE